MKLSRAIVAIIIWSALAIGCSHIPGLRGLAEPSPFDSVTYQVIGAQPGNVTVLYMTPLGAKSETVQILPPWQSGVVAGYGEFHGVRPSLTVTLQGCALLQIFVNAQKVAEKNGCSTGFVGTITVTQ